MQRFQKPADDRRTEHLYLVNYGSNIEGCSEDRMRNILREMSIEGVTKIIIEARHTYVSFRSVAASVDAAEKINTSGKIDGRSTKAMYASLRINSHVREPMECTSETKDVVVPGMRLLDRFISEEEEGALLTRFYSMPWLHEIKARRVQHYGHAFDYGTLLVGTKKPPSFPPFLDTILKRIHSCSGARPNQLTVNEYVCGKGIRLHVDTHAAFKGPILSLSLASDVVMVFRHTADHTRRKLVRLPRRSLLIMSNQARLFWEHGIMYKKTDKFEGVDKRTKRGTRVSLTFRQTRDGEPCTCGVCTAFRSCDEHSMNEAPDMTMPVDGYSVSKFEHLIR